MSNRHKIIFSAVCLLLGIFVVIGIGIYSSLPKSKPESRQQTIVSIPIKEEGYITNQLIIKYRNGQSPEELEELIKKENLASRFFKNITNQETAGELLQRELKIDLQANIQKKEKVFSSNEPSLRGFYLLTFPNGSDLPALLELYKKQDFIESIEPNFVMELFDVPNDTYYPREMWHLQKIQMEQAWDITKGTDAIKVAVIDSGIDYNHEDLSGRVINGYDFSSCSQINPTGTQCLIPKSRSSNAMDNLGHGTHVAGTIGALTNNAKGIAGVAWNVKLLAVKVAEDRGMMDNDVADAIGYAADQNANVINMSFGGYNVCPPSIQSAIDYALAKKIALVVAAGNSNIDASSGSPVNCNGILVVVGATNQNDGRAVFGLSRTGTIEASNFGTRVDIAAPGIQILSTRASRCTPQTCPPQYTLGTNYRYNQGTSMAAPHVAGVVALLVAKFPGITPQQIKDCLVNYADPINTDRPIGQKRLNAYQSLLRCNPPIPTPTPTPSPTSPPANTPTHPSPSTAGSRVFLTSLQYTGNLGGLSGADQLCQERANTVSLGGSWKAWLSSSSISAASRLIHSSLPYRLVNGPIIAQNWADLTDGTLLAPIDRFETGAQNTSENSVWTNTRIDGSIYEAFSNRVCDDWTNDTGSGYGANPDGSSTATNEDWTMRGIATFCDSLYRLYCFEQFSSPIATPTLSGGTGGGTNPAPIKTPTPTPIPYNCRYVPASPAPGSGLQMQTLECTQ